MSSEKKGYKDLMLEVLQLCDRPTNAYPSEQGFIELAPLFLSVTELVLISDRYNVAYSGLVDADILLNLESKSASQIHSLYLAIYRKIANPNNGIIEPLEF